MVLGALAEGPLEAALAGHRRRRHPDRQALSTLPLSSSSNPSAARSWPSPPAGAGKLKELTHHCTDDASVVDARRKVAPDVGSGCAHSFTFKDILVATGYFDAANFIGEGGFGKVYKGKISRTNPQGVCDAQMVAVKQLARERVHGSTEFLVEVLMLTILSHPNLVSLVGFCAQGDERLLVYEYMPFGSLESHLFGWFSRWIVQTSLEYIFLYSRRRI